LAGATRPVQGGAYSGPRSEPGGQNTPRAGRVVAATGVYAVTTGLFMQQVDQGDIFDDSGTGTVTASGTATESCNVGTPTAYDSVIDTDNPVSHWKLNQASLFVDRKALTHIPVTTPVTLVGGLLVNNGSDSAVSMTAGANSITKGAVTGQGLPYETPTWSMEAWVKVSALAGAPAPTIFSRAFQVLKITGNITPPPRSVSPLVLSGGYLRAEITDTGNIVRNIDSAITFGSVYHLVATYDGTNMVLYVNGAEISRVATPAAKTLSSTAPDFSTTAQSASYVLDEVAWYGTALSPARILAHYQAGAVVYDDSGTGTVSSSGAGSEDYSHDASSSDTITASGTGTELYSPPIDYTDATSGTATASGTGVETYACADSGAGTLTASGTGTGSQVHAASGTCTVTATGIGFQTYTPYDAVLDEDLPVSHWKLGNASTAIDRRQTLNLPAIGGPIGTAAGLVANNASDQSNVFTGVANVNFDAGSGTGRGVPYEGAWTMEMWVKPAADADSKIIVRTVGTYLALFNTGLGTHVSAICSFENSAAVRFSLLAPPEFRLPVNQTSHIVGTYDGTTAIIYVNGVEAARTTSVGVGGIRSSLTTPLSIGGSQSGIWPTVTVDEVAWYNGVLSPARILAHYQAGTATSYDVVVDADVPVSHWKLGWSTTKAVDRARRRLDLIAQNPPIAISAKGVAYQGDNDRANTFVTGSSQRFSNPTSGDSDANGTLYSSAPLSVEAWIKPTATSVVGGGWGVVRHPGSSLQLSLLNTKVRFEFNDPSNATKTVDSPTLVVASTVYHLVGTFDGTNLVLYVNGVEKARLATATGIRSDPTLYPAIGLTGSYWDGDIDEVVWYDTALSPARVQAHFLAGLAGYATLNGTGADSATHSASGSGTVTASGDGVEDYQPGAAGVTYTDSASGTATASGTSAESAAHDASGTCTATASGTALESASAADAATCTATASGTGTESATHSASGTGSATASGTGVEVYAFSDSGTATATASGTGTESATHSASGTCTATGSGTSVEAYASSDTSIGTATASGTSTESATHSGSGTATTTASGTGVESYAYADSRTATATASGTGAEAYVFSDTGAGTATTSGAGTDAATHSASGTCTVTASGSGVESYTLVGIYNDSAVGTVTAVGTGAESYSSTDSAAGTVTTTGGGAEAYSYADSALGTSTTTGTGADSFSYLDSADGTIIVLGSGTEAYVVAPTALLIATVI
jgi:hypothetical protein